MLVKKKIGYFVEPCKVSVGVFINTRPSQSAVFYIATQSTLDLR